MIRAPLPIDSREAEAYRSLRTTLSFTRLPENRRVVLFTSAQKGEGKSTTAVNFAAVCAYAERPTLLVDADLRNPSLHTVFERPALQGLSTFLAAAAGRELADVARPTPVPYLDFVPAGPIPRNAPELLARPALAELLEAARGVYDWVVVDAPPVLPVADAVILAKAVDGVALVLDLRRTPLAVARRARDLLRAVDAPLLGVIANRTSAQGRGYGYGYGRSAA